MAIVSMLATSPKNGVEMMDEMEKMTQGWWRPSPGSIYPLLEQLTKDGMIKKRDDGRYDLTEKANEELEWVFPAFRKQRTLDDMFNEISGYISYIEELSKTDPAKTEQHREKLKTLAERLAALAENS